MLRVHGGCIVGERKENGIIILELIKMGYFIK